MGKCVCFTGHRPEKLLNPYNEEHPCMKQIKQQLKNHILDAIEEGFDSFYSGVARGIDIISSEIVLDYKKECPQIKHFAVIPYEKQSQNWTTHWKQRYANVLASSDGTFLLSQEYYKGCLWARNAFMVENSDRVIAVYYGGKNGTYNTICLANKANKEIILIEKQISNRF